MSPFSWFLLLVVAAIFLFGFILIVARIARPHSKKMARGQAQLNKKRGATAPTAAGTAGISSVTPSTLGERASEWFMKYLWSILIVVALVGLVLWGLSGTLGTPSQSLQSPSLKTVWEGTKNYWLWIVLILAIMFFLSFFIAKPWAKALQWLSAITALLLFAVFPVLVGIRGDESPNPQACSHFGSTESGSCWIVEDGVILTSTEAFPDGKFELCYLKPEKVRMTQEWLGPNAIRFKSQKDKFLLTYKMIERKTLVNGNCPTSL